MEVSMKRFLRLCAILALASSYATVGLAQILCSNKRVYCQPSCAELPFANFYEFIDVRSAEIAGFGAIQGQCGTVGCLQFDGWSTVIWMKCFSVRFDVAINDCTGFEYVTEITLCCGNPAYGGQCEQN